MKKRIVAMVLGLAMAASVMTGCGSEEVSESPESSASEKVSAEASEESAETSTEEVKEAIPVDYFAGTELDIVVKKHSYDTGDSWGDKPAMKAAEKATGIKIN